MVSQPPAAVCHAVRARRTACRRLLQCRSSNQAQSSLQALLIAPLSGSKTRRRRRLLPRKQSTQTHTLRDIHLHTHILKRNTQTRTVHTHSERERDTQKTKKHNAHTADAPPHLRGVGHDQRCQYGADVERARPHDGELGVKHIRGPLHDLHASERASLFVGSGSGVSKATLAT
jgi:hypothetical protein